MNFHFRNGWSRQFNRVRLDRRTRCDKLVQYNIYDARYHFSELARRASAGEQIVIARAGVPIALLVPLESPVPTRPGVVRGHFVVRDTAP